MLRRIGSWAFWILVPLNVALAVAPASWGWPRPRWAEWLGSKVTAEQPVAPVAPSLKIGGPIRLLGAGPKHVAQVACREPEMLYEIDKLSEDNLAMERLLYRRLWSKDCTLLEPGMAYVLTGVSVMYGFRHVREVGDPDSWWVSRNAVEAR